MPEVNPDRQRGKDIGCLLGFVVAFVAVALLMALR